MTSTNVKMKLLGCICVYALTSLLAASNGQSNSTENTTIPNEHKDINKGKDFESAAGQNLSTVEINDKDGRLGNEINGATAVYDDGGKKNLENISTTFNFTKSTTDNDTIRNESKVHDNELNGTDVVEHEEEHDRNLTNKIQDQATTTKLPLPEAEEKNSSSWGYVILLLILLLVLALCIILFYMRRVSHTYSFDLHRPAPVRTNEPTGTFEPVYLDDLDYQIHSFGNEDANGTVLSNEDKEPTGGEGKNEQLQTNGLQTSVPPESSPTENTEPDQEQPDQDQESYTDQLSPSPILFIEETDEETNVNNNNPLVHSSDSFVDINLEEPQSSSTSPSSVQPFSPSIFSSLS